MRQLPPSKVPSSKPALGAKASDSFQEAGSTLMTELLLVNRKV